MRDDAEMLAEWNKIYCDYVAKNRDLPEDSRININKKMADYCENLILKAKEEYYNGQPIISDRWYDKLEDFLMSLRPSSKVLEKVGS